MHNLDQIPTGVIVLLIIVAVALVSLFSAALWRDQMRAWRAAASDGNDRPSSPTDQATQPH